MTYPVISAGQRITAQMLTDMQWHEVVQEVEIQIANSATVAGNETNIRVPMVEAATYRYFLLVGYSCADVDTTDIRLAWTVPTGAVVSRWAWGMGYQATGVVNSQTEVLFRKPATATDVIAGGIANEFHSYYEQGLMKGGIGGEAILQIAQGFASASVLTVQSATRVDYLRIA